MWRSWVGLNRGQSDVQLALLTTVQQGIFRATTALRAQVSCVPLFLYSWVLRATLLLWPTIQKHVVLYKSSESAWRAWGASMSVQAGQTLNGS